MTYLSSQGQPGSVQVSKAQNRFLVGPFRGGLELYGCICQIVIVSLGSGLISFFINGEGPMISGLNINNHFPERFMFRIWAECSSKAGLADGPC